MKKLLIPTTLGLLLLCAFARVNAQAFKEHITKEFTPQKAASASVLTIYNVWGSIKVEGYAGDKVLMEIDKTISGKTSDIVEQGKQEFKLAFEQTSDTMMAYIAEPYDSRPHEWRYNNWNNNHIEYKYTLEFTIKVPYSMNLHVSTVNEGDVVVENVTGALSVHNVNGPITITNAKGTTDAHTINGNLTVNYLSVPPESSSYYTLNGKLEVTYPANLSADLEFKSMNGGFYTDFPDFEVLPTRITKNVQKKDGGTIYKLNKDTALRFGSGGRTFKFETLNGNIYIKKQS